MYFRGELRGYVNILIVLSTINLMDFGGEQRGVNNESKC